MRSSLQKKIFLNTTFPTMQISVKNIEIFNLHFIIEIDIKPNLLTLSAVFSSEASREILKHDLALTEGAIQKSNLSHLLSCNYEGAQSLQRIDSSGALFVLTNSYHFGKFSFNCQ